MNSSHLFILRVVVHRSRTDANLLGDAIVRGVVILRLKKFILKYFDKLVYFDWT